MTTPSRLYLAQLVTAQSAEVRRVAVPTEAFDGGERDIYRAIRAVANDAPLVTLEAVVAELREGADFGGKTCADLLSAPQATGSPTCRADCTIDTSTCNLNAACGDVCAGSPCGWPVWPASGRRC